MKNKLLLLVFLILLALVIPACGNPGEDGSSEESTDISETEETTPAEKIDTFGSTANSLFVYSNLVFQDIMLADFDTSKYDVEEFRGFLEADIASYNSTHNFKMQVTRKDADGNIIEPPIRYTHPIEIKKLEAVDNVLNQQLLYATAEDFLEYNSDTLKKRGGSLLKVGKVSGNESEIPSSYTGPKGDTVSVSALLKDSETGGKAEDADAYYFVICDFDAVIYSDGEFVGVNGGTYDSETNSVIVEGGTAATVIYR